MAFSFSNSFSRLPAYTGFDRICTLHLKNAFQALALAKVDQERKTA